MFCRHCGKPVGSNDNFCSHCGKQLSIDLSKFSYPDTLPEGYFWDEGQFGRMYIVKKGSASDRPPGM